MVAILRKLASRAITPGDAETSLVKRGFVVKSPESKEVLETIGKTFLRGYSSAVEVGSPEAIPARLCSIPARYRGFAYEGAAMGFAMVDALTFAKSRRVRGYLVGAGEPHIYMAYIGVGWAMARLPRFRWPRLPLDPLLQWFLPEGYGFHQAYFHTDRYVRRHHREPAAPWPFDDPHGYAARAIDQGVGRALWFVGGTDPDAVAALIEGFAPDRRADLYSGAGLAATYAGGADEDELRSFWKRAGEHRRWVAQGSAFAAEARQRAGLATPHTALATGVFCEMSPDEAARVCLDLRPDHAAVARWDDRASGPVFERWRQDIADKFASLERG
ncbi:DUF1702 family protein [Actinomadura kijaniata]|uniref:DUF1702 family protein n=1 Tax=Actinomadura kijaniata TaxID=46161 RepID=UPI003F1B9C2A